MTKIVINTSSFAAADRRPLEKLEQERIQYSLNPYRRQLKEEEIIELSQEAIGMIAGTEPLNKNVLTRLKNLKVISRCGVGQENVDLKTAEALGIKVFTTPDSPTDAVAELTVGLILNILRRITHMNQNLKQGFWNKEMGNLLKNKKIGIVGFGRIGQKVAGLLQGFNTEIRYYDPRPIFHSMNCQAMGFEALLQWADVVSLHLSTSSISSIINEKEIRMMKKGSWLVNVARGEVVHEIALYNALFNGHLAGAALDVFSKEPYKGALQNLDNIILTPHIGSYAVEARIAMEVEAVENLIEGLRGTR